MTSSASTRALCRATSALVRDHDLTGVLADLLADAVEATDAKAGALLMSVDDGLLEVLSATSHRARELELYQAQERSGPCPDAVSTGEMVHVAGAERLVETWGDLGQAMVDAGYLSVRAFPMRWRGKVMGAMNLFGGTAEDADAEEQVLLGQSFADIATLLIVHPEEVTTQTLRQRTAEALAGRTVVEQAKGVIAYREDVGMDTAYERLRELAGRRGITLSQAASEVVAAATRGRA